MNSQNNFQPNQPERPAAPVPPAPEHKTPPTPTPRPDVGPIKLGVHKNTGFKVATIILIILLVGVIGAGVWGYFYYDGVLKSKDQEISKLQSETKVPEEKNEPAEVKTVAEDGYIYVGEWGIKIKLSDKLKNVSYSFDSSDKTMQVLRIWGNSAENTATADFYIPKSNTNGLAAISRTEKGKNDCKASCPTLIGTVGEYDYYYGHPQSAFEKDQTKQQQESGVVEILKEILSNPDNYSAF